MLDTNNIIYEEYVRLFDKALRGTRKDVLLLAKKNFKKFVDRPELQQKITDILSWAERNEPSYTRGINNDSLPIDSDSRLELLRRESIILDFEPVWPAEIKEIFYNVIAERTHEDELLMQGLHPTKSMLFVGPPGVGKTLGAKWLAKCLNRELLTLDLATVMSSFLGRTGNNLRAVLNYAMQTSAILLLDEFDAIAKKRDDSTEVGELKRLVTVLLQAIDEWPNCGILIAATNHPELLDPAVWRRFERVINFPLPSESEVTKIITTLIKTEENIKKEIINLFAISLQGSSFAEIVRVVNSIRRESIIRKEPLEVLIEREIKLRLDNITRDKKINAAKQLIEIGVSQRRTAELIGISRDTIRKYT